jgi:hypothetical protein
MPKSVTLRSRHHHTSKCDEGNSVPKNSISGARHTTKGKSKPITNKLPD